MLLDHTILSNTVQFSLGIYYISYHTILSLALYQQINEILYNLD